MGRGHCTGSPAQLPDPPQVRVAQRVLQVRLSHVLPRVLALLALPRLPTLSEVAQGVVGVVSFMGPQVFPGVSEEEETVSVEVNQDDLRAEGGGADSREGSIRSSDFPT